MTTELTKNIESEAAVLGSMLLDRNCIAPVREVIRDNLYFSLPEHQLIFDAVCSVFDADEELDLVILRDVLKRRKSLDAVGGVEYLTRLAETVPSSANALYYAKLMLDAYKRRKMIEQADAIRKAAVEPGNIAEVVNNVQSDICELAGEMTAEHKPDGETTMRSHFAAVMSHKYRVIPLPWSILTKLTNAIQPGMVTILCGSPGASKSFSALEILVKAKESGVPTSYYALEHDQKFHLSRCLAQKTQIGGLTDANWIADNQIMAGAALDECADWIKDMEKSIFLNRAGQTTYGMLTTWILHQARSGRKLLIIDPVTAVQHVTRDTWSEDNKFLQKTKQIMVDYGVAVMFITHPSKSQGKMPGMEGLAGGATFSRFSQTIFWLEAHDAKTSDVRSSMGTCPTEHNRTVHILKSTLGPGQGARIAATFGESLTLHEHGVIVKKQRKVKE